MNTKRFAKLSFLVIIVFAPLMIIDWATIIRLIGYIIPIGGIELYAVAGVFILAIDILPVVGLSPALTARVNSNRFKKWTNQAADREGNAFIGFATLIFAIFVVTFLTMSVSNPERFIIGRDDPVLEMFPSAVANFVSAVADRASDNVVMASFIVGLLPCFTTLISFVVNFLICLDKKEDRLEAEILDCLRRIEKASGEIDELGKVYDRYDSEKVLLDNLSDDVGEIERRIDEYKKDKNLFIERSTAEQRNEQEAANAEIRKQCWLDFNYFFNRGRQKFEPVIRGNPAEGGERLSIFEDFYMNSREKIAAAMCDEKAQKPQMQSQKPQVRPLKLHRLNNEYYMRRS